MVATSVRNSRLSFLGQGSEFLDWRAGNLIFEKFEQARGRQVILCVATAVAYLKPNSRPERSS